MITLNLTRGKDLEGIYIRLPAPQEKIEEAMARLDAISEDSQPCIYLQKIRLWYIKSVAPEEVMYCCLWLSAE